MDRRDFMTGALAAGGLSPLLARPGLAAMQNGAASSRAVAQVLVFDTFGTVVDWRSSVTAEGERLGRAKGIQGVDWAAFADAWRGGYGPSMNRVRHGELPWTKLDALHRMILDTVLTDFKLTGLRDEEKSALNLAWHRLTNGNLSLLTNMAKHARLPWDCILSTELVRHYKPDKETYLMPPAFFDLPPGEVMMVAAHPGDLDAAKALGLKTAYVHRPLEQGAGKPSTRPEKGRYDYNTSDFKELAIQLGA